MYAKNGSFQLYVLLIFYFGVGQENVDLEYIGNKFNEMFFYRNMRRCVFDFYKSQNVKRFPKVCQKNLYCRHQKHHIVMGAFEI
jgi:hypothetical protein